MSDLLTRLGLSVLLPRRELVRLIRSAPYRYKVYRIPKRKHGEFRTIAQPAREVKALQYWVMKKNHTIAEKYRELHSHVSI